MESATAATSTNDESSGPLDDKLLIPAKFEYRYLKGIRRTRALLGSTTVLRDILVIREEYEKMLATIEGEAESEVPREAIIVIGQPGIGSCKC